MVIVNNQVIKQVPNWIHMILILGSVQGFFLTVFIFHKRWDLYANRFLAAIIFLYSIILLHLVLDEMDFYQSRVFFKYGIETFPFFIGPLLYLYARSLIHNKKYKLKVFLWHALPGIIYLLFRSLYLLLEIKTADISERTTDYVIYNWAINLQAFVYMILILFLLKKYEQALKDIFAAIEKVKLTWLRNITMLMSLLLVIFLLENFLFLLDINFSNFFNLTSTIMAVSVYALGYMGLSRSEVFSSAEIAGAMRQLPQLDRQNKTVSYEKSGLSQEKALQHKQQLISLMENEKLFCDSNLTLSKVSVAIGVSPHNLSEVINKHLDMNFFDFINGYRVEQVKKDLQDDSKKNLTLIAIAFDAGFNSKSSFNAIFKKHTGKTPSEFRE